MNSVTRCTHSENERTCGFPSQVRFQKSSISQRQRRFHQGSFFFGGEGGVCSDIDAGAGGCVGAVSVGAGAVFCGARFGAGAAFGTGVGFGFSMRCAAK